MSRIRIVKHPDNQSIELETLLEKYNLTVSVHKRSIRNLRYGIKRWYAVLDNTYYKDGSVQVSTLGDGDTPECAIYDLCRRLSHKEIYRESSRTYVCTTPVIIYGDD